MIDTVKPTPYPDGTEPAHIHTLVRSPSQKHAYFIADFVFEGDKFLTPGYWRGGQRWLRSIGVYQDTNYGGVKLSKNGDSTWEGKRNITLFPEYDLPAPNSGRDILAESPAFDPQHAWGPDKGSHACPMCKFGYQPGVLFWVNSDNNWAEVEKWARWLEDLSAVKGEKEFKAYLIYTNPRKLDRTQLETKLAALGQKLDLTRIAVTYVPGADDRDTYAYLNQIDPATENTVIVYNNRKIADKFVNLAFNEQNSALLKASIERAGKEKELYGGK